MTAHSNPSDTSSITTHVDAPPLIAYFGQHKSGSNWIQHIMKEACVAADLSYDRFTRREEFGSDLRQWVEETGTRAVSWVNAEWPYVASADFRAFHVVRDPRDILVSGYFSHLKTHPTENWPNLISFRKRLQSAVVDKGLRLEMDFMYRVWLRMAGWPLLHPNILTMRLEDFGDAYAERFRTLFTFIGLFQQGLTEAAFEQIMHDNAVKKIAAGKTTHGKTNMSAHYRKGQHGDWRNYLTDEHIEMVRERLNPILLKYEYETDPNWT